MNQATQQSYSWLAIRGDSRARALPLLRLELKGEAATGDTEYALAEISDGIVIVAQRFDFADQSPLAELSHGGDLITCCVHEPLMYSSISGWHDGQRTWYFFHDGSIGIQHMHVEGDPPREFHAIANRLLVNQAEGEGIAITMDHVFEVAAQVAEALTGFRYGEDSAEQTKFPLQPLTYQ